MKKLAIIILVITLLFAFTLPALAQKTAPVTPNGSGLDNWGQGKVLNNLGQGKGLDNWGQERRLENPGQGGFKTYPVPEPNTLMLILLIGPGLAVYAGIKRKMKKG